MEEEYDFDDRDRCSKDILKMLEQGSLHDVKIKLSDGDIFANKDILMARSEYFATMFSNNKFIEGESSTVDLSHCSKAVMEKIVKFLFIGAVNFDNLTTIQLLELSHMTKMMLLAKFQDHVDEYLENEIGEISDMTVLTSALKCANQYNLKLEFYVIKEIIVEMKTLCDDENKVYKGILSSIQVLIQT